MWVYTMASKVMKNGLCVYTCSFVYLSNRGPHCCHTLTDVGHFGGPLFTVSVFVRRVNVVWKRLCCDFILIWTQRRTAHSYSALPPAGWRRDCNKQTIWGLFIRFTKTHKKKRPMNDKKAKLHCGYCEGNIRVCHTFIHWARARVTLFVSPAASELHQLNVKLIQYRPIQRADSVYQLETDGDKKEETKGDEFRTHLSAFTPKLSAEL